MVTITNKTQAKGFTLLEILTAIVLLAMLAGMGHPLILRSTKPGDRLKTANNAKVLAGALNEFRTEQGLYPCAATRKLLEEEGIKNLPKGKDSNAYLAQLVVSDIVESEKSFFTPGVPGMVEGDDLKKPAELLKKGENGFCYIMAENEQPLAGDLSVTPIIIAPLKKDRKNLTFDPKPYDGKYVCGTIGGAAQTGEIDDKGVASSKGRTSLFETGRDSLFGDDVPVVKGPTGL